MFDWDMSVVKVEIILGFWNTNNELKIFGSTTWVTPWDGHSNLKENICKNIRI